ncbi:DUF2202 domain-containing protein [Hydrogenophaga sp.]|uniref:DUF2202 domain-containing protein n=1 Tax=Hydrogenophaga sp. TaxID=1904254 RepID=UPI002636529A|nr:DUF2202 domain-containing protein [Hydrogenophaga sp.]MDM7951546.1 DUF2202 domain-containing protein [Hydrogenophaga sp.]
MRRDLFLRCAGAALGGLVIGPVLSGCGGGDEELADAALPADRTAVTTDPATSSAPAVPEDLSAEEIAGLLFMREEEKLAYDVYVALFNRWGHNVFNQIAQSEAQHAETMRLLVLAHGLVDPAAGNPPGVFVNTDLQAMYDTLVARGQTSLIDALKVGCLIEEKDIQDINDKKAEVLDEPDIVQVYDNLLCGSRNHLRAFNRTLVSQGGVYVPEVITQAEWDAIANSPNETCGG